MIRTMPRYLLLLALTGLVTAGCSSDESAEESGGWEVLVAAQSAEGCTSTNNKSRDFPEGVERFEVVVTTGGETFKKRILPSDLSSSGEVLVTGVPTGDSLQVDLYGCTGNNVTWSGRAPTVNVAASQKTSPRFFFTKKNTFNCTGSALANGNTLKSVMEPARAYHQVVPITGERYLITGGFNIYLALDPQELLANEGEHSVTEYRPDQGVFRQWDQGLLSVRGLHHAVPFDNGRKVLVIGGLTRVALQAAPNAPIVPGTSSEGEVLAPTNTVELLDVLTETVSASTIDFKPKPLTAMAHSSNGLAIVLAGGRETDGSPSNLLERVADNVTQIASGKASVVRNTLGVPRMGNTANFFGGGSVLVLGGNFDQNAGSLAEVVDDKLASHSVAVDGSFQPTGFGFHETTLLRSDGCKHAFLVSGGLGLQLSQSNKPLYISASKNDTPLMLFELDTCTEGSFTGRFSDQSSIVDLTRLRRVFHQVTALGDDMLMVSGGYNQLSAPTDPSQWCATSGVESGCYLSDVMLLSVGGASSDDVSLTVHPVDGLNLSGSRFGHNVIPLLDGTALASGGLRARDKDVQNLRADTEIFNVLRPSESDFCLDAGK